MFIQEGDYVVLKKETNMKVVQVTLNRYVCCCCWTLKTASMRRIPHLDFSYPSPQERKFQGTWNESYQELSFPGPFVLGNFRSQRTKVPGTFRARELWSPLSDRPSRRFALCA